MPKLSRKNHNEYVNGSDTNAEVPSFSGKDKDGILTLAKGKDPYDAEVYKIEKDVSMEEYDRFVSGEKRLYDFPFPSMAVGDSFFVSCDTKNRERLHSSVTGSANYYGHKFHKTKKFSTRIIKNESGDFLGIRVWRTK